MVPNWMLTNYVYTVYLGLANWPPAFSRRRTIKPAHQYCPLLRENRWPTNTTHKRLGISLAMGVSQDRVAPNHALLIISSNKPSITLGFAMTEETPGEMEVSPLNKQPIAAPWLLDLWLLQDLQLTASEASDGSDHTAAAGFHHPQESDEWSIPNWIKTTQQLVYIHPLLVRVIINLSLVFLVGYKPLQTRKTLQT